MLEAMQEKQTSIGGKNYELPKPFVVLATQNPIEQEGTYELPEAQLDRFLIKEVLSYPTIIEELEVLKRIESGVLTQRGTDDLPRVELDRVVTMQHLVQKVYIDDAIKNYIVQVVAATRQPAAAISADLANISNTVAAHGQASRSSRLLRRSHLSTDVTMSYQKT